MKDTETALEMGQKPSKLITLTTPDITGPFYMGGAPMRDRFGDYEVSGEPLLIYGKVIDPSGKPVAGATVDLWQANHAGEYDFTNNFQFRGKVLSDENGNYQIPTVLPGNYCDDGRWRVKHIHFTASAPEHVEVTSQIYFTGDEYLSNDPWASAPAADCRTLELLTSSDGNFSARFDLCLDSLDNFQSSREGSERGYVNGPNPDPFSDAVLIQFGLYEDGLLDARVYSSDGEEVYIMTGGERRMGRHLIHWEGKKQDKSLAPSGTYQARFKLNDIPFGTVDLHIDRN